MKKPFALIAALLLATPAAGRAEDCTEIRRLQVMGEEKDLYPLFLGWNGKREKAFFVPEWLVDEGSDPRLQAIILDAARDCNARVLIWEEWNVNGNLKLGEKKSPEGNQ